jgi:hypothetical protein
VKAEAPAREKAARGRDRNEKKPEKSRAEPRPSTPFGDHVPAFILRPTEIKA